MDFKKGFFKNVLVFGGYNYLSQAIIFSSNVIAARLLGPENFGFFSLITVFTGFISMFLDSGISLAIIRSDYLGSFHKSVDALALLIGFLLFLITSLLAYPIAYFYENYDLVIPIIVMSTIFVFRSITLVRGAILSKHLKFGTIGQVTLLSTLVNSLGSVAMAYYGFGYWSLIIPQILSVVLIFILYENKTRIGFRIYAFPYIKVAYKHTKRTIGNLMGFNMVNYWARNSDNLLVGKIYGMAELGIYNRAYTLLTTPLTLISGLIGTVLYPSLKKLKSTGQEIHSEYLFILKVISLISLPLSVVLVLFPEEIVGFLWGEKWHEVGDLLPYFGLLIFCQSMLSTVGNILVLVAEERALMICGLIGSVIMIASICVGSLFSVMAIAQLYSLVFIVIILPLNFVYIYIKTLKFNVKEISLFWIPFIVTSLVIWIGIFLQLPLLKYLGVLALAFFTLRNAQSDLIEGYKLARRKLQGIGS